MEGKGVGPEIQQGNGDKGMESEIQQGNGDGEWR